MKVRLEPSGLYFETDAGTTLLKAAEAAGIELPSSCRNGTCRTCICLRLSGETRHTIEWPGLSAEEKAEGWILPCVAQALGDLSLEAPGARSLFDD
jgi:ferredoxin